MSKVKKKQQALLAKVQKVINTQIGQSISGNKELVCAKVRTHIHTQWKEWKGLEGQESPFHCL